MLSVLIEDIAGATVTHHPSAVQIHALMQTTTVVDVTRIGECAHGVIFVGVVSAVVVTSIADVLVVDTLAITAVELHCVFARRRHDRTVTLIRAVRALYVSVTPVTDCTYARMTEMQYVSSYTK